MDKLPLNNHNFSDNKMDINVTRIRLFLLVAIALLLSGCGPKLYSNVDNEELQALLDKNVTLIDIRRPEEWRKTGIIEGSKTITLFDSSGRIKQEFFPKLMEVANPEAPVVLICRTGNRTRAASDMLAGRLKFRAVFNVSDGITGWIREGRPVIRYPG